MNINKSWFEGSSTANNFGWEPLTAAHNDPGIWPRIHLGNDYWPTDGNHLKHQLKTLVTGPVEFVNNDGAGNSILKQYAGDIEIQIYHLRHEELSSDIIAASMVKGTIVQAGTIIGPCGDVGIGHGRHAHLAIRAKSGVDLTPLLGSGWDKNKMQEYASRYGEIFIEKANADNRQILWMNDDVILRHSGYNGPLYYYINPAKLLP
jgi:murein DD-endopeptidase MepM/ murein hydrolase activator NlpD